MVPASMLSHLPLDQPSAWVRRFIPLIETGEALDLACGSGRHARLLASQGHPVLAVDRDPAALANAAGEGIATLQIDLEREGAASDPNWPFIEGRFAGIVVTNYLHRPLFVPILNSLAQGGILIYETFAQGNARYGKPSNPDFLLQPDELLRLPSLVPDQHFKVIAFEDGYVTAPKPAVVQRICLFKAQKDNLSDRIFPI